MTSVIFCLPGDSFSGNFLDSWNDLLFNIYKKGWKYTVCRKGNGTIYHCRNQLAGGGNVQGKFQIPYEGKLKFDWQIWIDSDQVFKPYHIFQLIGLNKDIVSGVYRTSDQKHTTIVESWDEEYFKKYRRWRKLTIDEVLERKSPFECLSMGFGLTVVRAGVLEKLEYPWFYPEYRSLPGGGYDFSSEDVGFCSRARAAGFSLWIDPSCVIGHEKSFVI